MIINYNHAIESAFLPIYTFWFLQFAKLTIQSPICFLVLSFGVMFSWFYMFKYVWSIFFHCLSDMSLKLNILALNIKIEFQLFLKKIKRWRNKNDITKRNKGLFYKKHKNSIWSFKLDVLK